jgi:hypothetical protein
MAARVVARSVLCLVALIAAVLPYSVAPASAQTDLDALMERVLKNRDQSWRQLQEFLLTEREQFSLTGPDFGRLFGMDREFIWVAQGGKAVRTLSRVNGVAATEAHTRDVEHEEATLGKFMRFPFDPGNYYLVGREMLAGVEVLRIEYYPTRLFRSDDEKADGDATADASHEERDPIEERLDFAFNKVTQVTLWVDPAQRQIVRATFDNVDFSFLPGRSLVRVEQAQATMEMGQPFPGVWLPVRTTIEGAATLATGTYRATYRRDYYDYKRTDVRVRYRIHEPEP